MTLYDSVKDEILDLIEDFRDIFDDGRVEISEVIMLISDFVEAAVVIMEDLNEDGETKKQAVIEAVQALWEELLEPLDIPWVPDNLVDPFIESILPTLVGILIDLAVAQFNKKGWPNGN